MEEKTLSKSASVSSLVLDNKKGRRKLSSQEAKKMAEKGKKSPKNGKHGKHKKTLLKEEVFKQVQDRLVERALKLIDTQTVIAHGTIKVYKIVTHYEGSGKNRRKVRGKPELVENDSEIAAAIDYEYGDGDSPSTDDEYFFVSTKDPDNKAIQSQIDRVMGKAPQKIEFEAGVGVAIITGMEIIKEPKKNEDPIQV